VTKEELKAWIAAARAEGYTDAEIAQHMIEKGEIDPTEARKEGYEDTEIIAFLGGASDPKGRLTYEPIAPKPEPDRSLGQNLGVVTSALAPYATAAGLGAAAGAPFAGVGAIPGAAGGILSLGLSDLGTGIYNAFTPLFDGQRVALPSETIRGGLQSVGVGRAPQTPEQEVLFRTVEGGASALGGASAFGTMAARQAPSATRNIFSLLGQQRRAQTAAGAGAAAAPSIASEYGDVTNPLALTGLSLAGGMTAGSLATPRPRSVTSAQLEAEAKAAYDRAEQAGVLFDPTSVADLGATIRQSFTANPKVQFDPILHPRINRVLQRIDEVAAEASQTGAPLSFSQVELLRRVARTAANSTDRDERRLGYDLIRQIDSFVDAPPPGAVVAGQAPEAASALKKARDAWRRMSQADALDTMVDRAEQSSQGLSASSLRQQARNVANNPNRMRAFDKDIQKEIKGLARGQGGLAAAETLGRLAPSFDLRNVRPGNLLAGGAGGAFYMGEPAIGAVGVGLGTTGLLSQALANQMARGRMASMTDRVRGTPQRKIPVPQIAAQSALPAVDLPGADLPLSNFYDEYGNPIRR
jgi:hypothetical protein